MFAVLPGLIFVKLKLIAKSTYFVAVRRAPGFAEMHDNCLDLRHGLGLSVWAEIKLSRSFLSQQLGVQRSTPGN